MKKIIVFLLFFFFQISLGQNTFTQYYFIRHAEKADSSKNPDLSEKGLERAQEWKTLFSEINFFTSFTALAVKLTGVKV